MVLKGRWETGERDEVIHFLLNQTPGHGKMSISLGELQVNMLLRGGSLVSLEVNGKPVRNLYEVKGVLLKILERSTADFLISNAPESRRGNLNLPFTALMMEVITLRDHIKAHAVRTEHRGEVLRLNGIPKGGDEEEFVRSLRLRYKNDIPMERLYRDYSHVSPDYLSYLISRLKDKGYISTVPLNGWGIPIHPVLLLLLVLLASAISGCVSVFLVFKAL